jgi:ornithine--oxo-acid transaminase
MDDLVALSAYSAVSHGHCHPKLVAALTDQAEQLTIVSRAFHTDKLAPFAEKICALTGFHKMLPMNTGAEAVETAIKAARRWGYMEKGIPGGLAEIIVAARQPSSGFPPNRNTGPGSIPSPPASNWCRSAT